MAREINLTDIGDHFGEKVQKVVRKATFVAENITGDLTSLQFKSTAEICGVITSVKLDSGTVIAYSL